jgi:hypothetical protein
MIIKLNIDVTKISKSRLHKGAKGTYANLTVLLRDKTDQYGNDGMIVEDVTQDERQAGTKGTILGNARIVGEKKQQPATSKPKHHSQVQVPPSDDDNSDIPF